MLNKAIFYIKYYAKKHDCMIERTFWSHDNENWFNVKEQANTKEKAEIKKTALETLNDESKVSYLVVQSRRIEKVTDDNK